MATSTKSPGTLAEDTSAGTQSWSNAGNAAANDGSYATASGAIGQVTYYLKATNFGFGLTSSSTVNGIQVRVEAKHAGCMGGSSFVDVKLVKAGTIQATDKATGSLTTSDAYYTFGATDDLWSDTWSYSDINNSGFGVAVSFNLMSPSTCTVYVDHVEIIITYTDSGGGTPTTIRQPIWFW